MAGLAFYLQMHRAWIVLKMWGLSIGVLFGCFARKIDGPGLPGG